MVDQMQVIELTKKFCQVNQVKTISSNQLVRYVHSETEKKMFDCKKAVMDIIGDPENSIMRLHFDIVPRTGEIDLSDSSPIDFVLKED